VESLAAEASALSVSGTGSMEQTITNAQSPFWRPKRIVLLVTALFSALIGVFVILLDEASPPFPFARVVGVICISLLVLAWCYFDSLERHQLFDSRFRVVILVFGLFALFVYLFKSRGLTQGMRSAGMDLLFCGGMVMIMVASAFVVAAISGIE
jgi:peptidoglycan/LPS O-acetylase OafA/YrhL